MAISQHAACGPIQIESARKVVALTPRRSLLRWILGGRAVTGAYLRPNATIRIKMYFMSLDFVVVIVVVVADDDLAQVGVAPTAGDGSPDLGEPAVLGHQYVTSKRRERRRPGQRRRRECDSRWFSFVREISWPTGAGPACSVTPKRC